MFLHEKRALEGKEMSSSEGFCEWVRVYIGLLIACNINIVKLSNSDKKDFKEYKPKIKIKEII